MKIFSKKNELRKLEYPFKLLNTLRKKYFKLLCIVYFLVPWDGGLSLRIRDQKRKKTYDFLVS